MEQLRIEVIDRVYAAVLAAKTPENESRWQTLRIEPLEPLCTVVFCSSTPIGRASSNTANTCGDY